jgi:hypothetical protein
MLSGPEDFLSFSLFINVLNSILSTGPQNILFLTKLLQDVRKEGLLLLLFISSLTRFSPIVEK